MKLSTNFTLEEFCSSDYAERYGIQNQPTTEIIERLKVVASQLELVRTSLRNLPIIINSGYRCITLNRGIGSSDSSAHVLGLAVDFKCPAYGTPLQVAKNILASGIIFDQLIEEGKWVHLSVDPRMRGDVLTTKFIGGKAVYKKGLRNE